MTRIRVFVSGAVCLLVFAAALSGPPAGTTPKAKPRKCPADKVAICGQDIARVLAMLGAKRQASDNQIRSYMAHFDRSDPNRDGKHSRAEYVDGGKFMNPRARAGIFGAADNNADGTVTRAEYLLNRIITDEAKAIVQRTDADKNGKVTRDEFVKGSPLKDKTLAAAVYDALDTSGDKVITIPEYLRVWGSWARPNYKAQEAELSKRLAKLGKDKKPDKSKKRSTKPSGKPVVKPSEKPSGGPPSVDRVFKIMDGDKDGKLTKAEFRGPKFVFDGADKNKDGIVTRKELETFRAARGDKSKPKRKPGKPHVKIGQAATDFELPVLVDLDGKAAFHSQDPWGVQPKKAGAVIEKLLEKGGFPESANARAT